MVKICTITCHDVYNHGASLQAFALMKYLENQGHDVRIIDYKPDYLSNHYNMLSINNPKWERNILTKLLYLLIKIPFRIPGLKRKKAFDRFTAKYLKLTDFRYFSNDDLREKLPNADIFICGSDQIWNTINNNGKDPAFYLDFVPKEKIKLAYAASFATETISGEYKEMVRKWVQSLDGVGVREKSGVEILKNLKLNNAVHVVDPVFLLDKKDWENISKGEFKEKYILVYDFDNSTLIKKLAEEISTEIGCKIYIVNPTKQKYADRYFPYCGPDTFISLIKDAEYIISNSFHAAVFSIIYQKQFVIVNRSESINSRMIDLLSELKLSDRLVSGNYCINKLLKEIDHINSNKLLNEKIQFSKNYLQKNISREWE